MPTMSDLKQRYERLNGSRPVEKRLVDRLEKDLGLSFPSEFREVTGFFDGSGFSVFPLHAIGTNVRTNILSETLRLRDKIALPRRFVVLGEPPESLLLLDCDKGEVLWCDAIDASRIGEGSVNKAPDRWPSFGTFFDHLL